MAGKIVDLCQGEPEFHGSEHERTLPLAVRLQTCGGQQALIRELDREIQRSVGRYAVGGARRRRTQKLKSQPPEAIRDICFPVAMKRQVGTGECDDGVKDRNESRKSSVVDDQVADLSGILGGAHINRMARSTCPIKSVVEGCRRSGRAERLFESAVRMPVCANEGADSRSRRSCRRMKERRPIVQGAIV